MIKLKDLLLENETPKGDTRGKSSSTEDTPEDDPTGSRGGKDSI